MANNMQNKNAMEKEIESIKEILQEIIIPTQRANLNLIPEHVTKLRGNKSTKQLNRKKINKKSATLTRKEKTKLGLYNLPTNSIQYHEAKQLHQLWKGYMKENLSLNDKFKAPEFHENGYEAFSKLLMKSDLHGAKLKITKSKNTNLVGINGIVVLDTKNTFKLVGKDDKLRTIPKADCIFTMNLDKLEFIIFGKHLTIRPAERSAKKIKSFIDIDL